MKTTLSKPQTCQHEHLKRIGVRGIKQCADCGSLVDLRKEGWLKRWVAAAKHSSRPKAPRLPQSEVARAQECSQQ